MKELARDPKHRPFDDGQHMCPGRFVMKQAIFAFIALTFSRFDVCLQRNEKAGNSRDYSDTCGFNRH